MFNSVKSRILKSIRYRICPPNQSHNKLGSFLECANLSPEDVFLTSYPRSGNTWVRTILAYMLYPPERITSLKILDELVPSIGRSVPEPSQPPKMRVIKTHRPYAIRHERDNVALYHKNIYIVRHPFDVTRSFYDYTKHLNWWPERNLNLEDFVYELTYGVLLPTSWQGHFLSWYATRKQTETLFLRYEDISADTRATIKQLANFLNLTLSETQITSVIENSSLDAMRKLEEAESLIPKDYNFVRREKAQRASTKLTPAMTQLIWKHSEIAAEICGYTVDGTLPNFEFKSVEVEG